MKKKILRWFSQYFQEGNIISAISNTRNVRSWGELIVPILSDRTNERKDFLCYTNVIEHSDAATSYNQRYIQRGLVLFLVKVLFIDELLPKVLFEISFVLCLTSYCLSRFVEKPQWKVHSELIREVTCLILCDAAICFSQRLFGK